MGEVSEEKHPVDGHIMNLRKDVKKPEMMADYLTFCGPRAGARPVSVLHPASVLTEAVDRFQMHGFQLSEAAVEPASLVVEEFRIDGMPTALLGVPEPQRTHCHRRMDAGATRGPAGTLRLDMAQPLARLAFYLIEPRSDDGLIDWNFVG